MKLLQTSQIDFSAIPLDDLSGIIVASGYEKRATYIAQQIKKRRPIVGQNNFAIGFTDQREKSRRYNNTWFKRNKFEIIDSNADDPAAIVRVFSGLLPKDGIRSVSVLIDYSCMTRIWYAAILSHIRYAPIKAQEVNLYFTYTVPEYFLPAAPTPNSSMGPIPGFCHPGPPDLETALIIGSGHEGDRAMGLSTYIDAKSTYFFYTDPAGDRRFTSAIIKNNKALMKKVGPSFQVKYPHNDLHSTEVLLSNVCRRLGLQHRIILAPLGPKPFALLCLLASIEFSAQGQFVDVWRVSSTGLTPARDRLATGEIIVCKVTFVQ